MAEVFNWIRPGYELVTAKIEWTVQMPFLQTTYGQGQMLRSHLFSPQETPNSKWALEVNDTKTQIEIYTYHYNYAGKTVNFVEPALVKMSILNKRRKKILQQMLSSNQQCSVVTFYLSKEDIIESKCQQWDGSLTFSCKIFTHVKKDSTLSSDDSSSDAINCRCQLSTDLDGLFYNMQFTDVIFKVRGREFPAHKSILFARSEGLAAMFQHPSKEQANQIEIEDIKPEVFQELLRFIYTGRVSTATMETMATGLLIAADKYELDELKTECVNYMFLHMSPDNFLLFLFARRFALSNGGTEGSGEILPAFSKSSDGD
jgi:speckle-type POZ protein